MRSIVCGITNNLGFNYLQRKGEFLSAWYVKGLGEYFDLHAKTFQAVNEVYAKSRKQYKNKTHQPSL